jgi:hypothetical protein
MKEEMHDLEKKAWEVEMKRRMLEKEYQDKAKKDKARIVVLEKENLMVKRRDNQYRHEIRKREKEFRDIQEKMVKNMAVKSKETWGGMDILNSLQGPRANWNKGVSKGEADLLQHTLASYEQRIGEVVEENQHLRQMLQTMDSEFQAAFVGEAAWSSVSVPPSSGEDAAGSLSSATSSSSIPPTAASMSPGSIRALEEFAPCQFDMPFAFVKDAISDGMRAKITVLKEKIKKLKEEGNSITANGGKGEFSASSSSSSSSSAASASSSAPAEDRRSPTTSSSSLLLSEKDQEIAVLKSRLGEQQQMLMEQDDFIQQAMLLGNLGNMSMQARAGGTVGRTTETTLTPLPTTSTNASASSSLDAATAIRAVLEENRRLRYIHASITYVICLPT